MIEVAGGCGKRDLGTLKVKD